MNEYDKSSAEPPSFHEYLVAVERYLHRPVPKARAEIRSLVLTARDIPHKVLRSEYGYHIAVHPGYQTIAATEIKKYEEENHTWPPVYNITPWYPNAQSTIWILLLLTAVFSICFSEHWRGLLLSVGSGDVDFILDGQWWRLITALTLHSDPPHLLGNMLIGGLLMIWLCCLLVIGTGWAVTLLSGILGNLLNALIHGKAHISIGSSTAIFGALGIIVALQTVTVQRFTLRDRVIPIGAGFALFAFLGSHGERTDLGAHLFGFLAGLILGFFAGQLVKASGLPRPNTDRILGLIACLVPILAWVAAFHLSP